MNTLHLAQPRAKLPALTALLPLALLCGCATLQPHTPAAPAPAPAQLAPVITAQDLHDAEVKSYREGFAAGRHYQEKQDAAAAAQTQAGPAPIASATATGTATPTPVATAPLPSANASPSTGFVTQGPAKPIALPGD